MCEKFICAETVPVRTVNRQCSSGLQAVADVAAAIRAGFYDIGNCFSPALCTFVQSLVLLNYLPYYYERYWSWIGINDT